MQEEENTFLTKEEEILDATRDEPSPADYSYEEILPLGITTPIQFDQIEFRTPIVFDQGAESVTGMACSRYGMVHIINAQNEFVANETKTIIEPLNPKPYWLEYLKVNERAIFEGATLQSALKQFYDNGLITGYATVNSIDLMKSALLRGNLIYTGSNNGDWTNVRTHGIYRLRSDNAIIGHAYCIVGFNPQGWLAINSYGESNGYFIIPYDLTQTLFTRYAVMDTKDKETITNYKRNIMQEITIEDAKLALEAKIWNGEKPLEQASRQEVAAMIYRALLLNK